MRHVALYVMDLQACEYFYVELLGMRVEWRPDAQNLYLSSGPDNLALHQAPDVERDELGQRLDHIGFVLAGADEVDAWFGFLQQQGVRMHTEPRNHRDGARSFYCCDPDGTLVQLIYHPPLVAWEAGRVGE
ncbi:MAG: VOC family protein [Gammaproteobacteria bacterium]|nr:VOC family protein [Gammaproteobacteria bacterium]